MKKLLKRKVEADASEMVEVSAKTKKFLESISERSGITTCDLITICCQNALRKGFLYPLDCKSCGRENWRDVAGIIYEMFKVDDSGVCGFCEARGDDFGEGQIRDLDDIQIK